MKRFLALILLCLSCGAFAQALEVITLKHRPVDEVLPVLQPLLEKGGVLTGSDGKLFLKASAGNRAQIRKALAALDTERRRLMISVMQDRSGRYDPAVVGMAGDVTVLSRGGETAPGSEARRRDEAYRSRSYGTHRDASEGVAQRVQVLEGSSAFLRVGLSLPMPLQSVSVGPQGVTVSESVVIRDLGSGFYARPTLQGQRFTVDIAPQKETLSPAAPGAIASERLRTSVSGHLGEWVELGGVDRNDDLERPGTKVYSTRGALERSRFMLKVEELP